MCEYQYTRDKGSGKHRKSIPMCSVTKEPCTFCTLTNKATYNAAKEREANEKKQDDVAR